MPKCVPILSRFFKKLSYNQRQITEYDLKNIANSKFQKLIVIIYYIHDNFFKGGVRGGRLFQKFLYASATKYKVNTALIMTFSIFLFGEPNKTIF